MAKSESYSPKLHKPATLDHLRKREPLERTVQIITSDAPIEAVEEAKKRLNTAELAVTGIDPKKPVALTAAKREVEEARKALQDAYDEQVEATVEMRFRSIGRRAYEEILDQHKPSEEQRKEAEEKNTTVNYDYTTFPAALVAACCIEPKMTEEDALDLYNEWNYSEFSVLFNAALECCTTRRVGDLGNVYGTTSG